MINVQQTALLALTAEKYAVVKGLALKTGEKGLTGPRTEASEALGIKKGNRHSEGDRCPMVGDLDLHAYLVYQPEPTE